MLQAPISNPIVTEKLRSVSSSQANQTGWTFRRVFAITGRGRKTLQYSLSYRAHTNRTQSFVLVFNPVPLMQKVFGCENVNRYGELLVGFASPRKFCRELVKVLAKMLVIVSRRLAMLTNDRRRMTRVLFVLMLISSGRPPRIALSRPTRSVLAYAGAVGEYSTVSQ